MTQQENTPIVHVTRSMDPVKPVLSPEIIRKHESSRRLYPMLNLSDGEYVIMSVRRHPIGLIVPQALGAVLIALTLVVMMGSSDIANNLLMYGSASGAGLIFTVASLFLVAIVVGMIISAYVYVSNKFFLTNESVIQEIQHSLFSKHEQTVSLANIEDASFTQKGVLQHMFNYGNVRLSTEGEETTYRFSYVANPKGHIDKLNNVVEAFKNGRPIED